MVQHAVNIPSAIKWNPELVKKELAREWGKYAERLKVSGVSEDQVRRRRDDLDKDLAGYTAVFRQANAEQGSDAFKNESLPKISRQTRTKWLRGESLPNKLAACLYRNRKIARLKECSVNPEKHDSLSYLVCAYLVSNREGTGPTTFASKDREAVEYLLNCCKDSVTTQSRIRSLHKRANPTFGVCVDNVTFNTYLHRQTLGSTTIPWHLLDDTKKREMGLAAIIDLNSSVVKPRKKSGSNVTIAFTGRSTFVNDVYQLLGEFGIYPSVIHGKGGKTFFVISGKTDLMKLASLPLQSERKKRQLREVIDVPARRRAFVVEEYDAFKKASAEPDTIIQEKLKLDPSTIQRWKHGNIPECARRRNRFTDARRELPNMDLCAMLVHQLHLDPTMARCFLMTSRGKLLSTTFRELGPENSKLAVMNEFTQVMKEKTPLSDLGFAASHYDFFSALAEQHPPLSTTACLTLLLLAQEGNTRARDTLVLSFIRMSLKLCKEYHISHDEISDVYGLIISKLFRSIEVFDPRQVSKHTNQPAKFSGYAYKCIKSQIMDYLRKAKRKAPLSLDTLNGENEGLANVLEDKTGSSLGLTPDDFMEALRAVGISEDNIALLFAHYGIHTGVPLNLTELAALHKTTAYLMKKRIQSILHKLRTESNNPILSALTF